MSPPFHVMTPRILIGIPFHPKKTYAIQHILDWVERQPYKNVEVIMRWHLGTFGERDAVKKQREFFRSMAEEKDFDYFYSMGADTVPPLDTLERLLAAKKDVVGALYRQRKDHTPLPIAWVNGDAEKHFLEPGGVVEVSGMGMDAVLLSRKAFTSFTYMDWPTIDDDGPAYAALRANGFKVYLDTDLECRHYMTEDVYV